MYKSLSLLKDTHQDSWHQLSSAWACCWASSWLGFESSCFPTVLLALSNPRLISVDISRTSAHPEGLAPLTKTVIFSWECVLLLRCISNWQVSRLFQSLGVSLTKVHLLKLMPLTDTEIHKRNSGIFTAAIHVTNDVCFISIMGAAILKFLPAQRRFSRFYDTGEHLLEDKRTSEVSKQSYLISQFDL